MPPAVPSPPPSPPSGTPTGPGSKTPNHTRRTSDGRTGSASRPSIQPSPVAHPGANHQMLPVKEIPREWHLYRSVIIFLRGIPNYTTTWDIWSNMVPYGNVVFIDLDEPRSDARPRHARIRFEPPPSRKIFRNDFFFNLKLKRETIFPDIWYDKPRLADGASRTPLGNRCPSLVTIPSQALTFGIPTTPTTVMAMRKVESAPIQQDMSLESETEQDGPGGPGGPGGARVVQRDQNMTFDFERMKMTVEFAIPNTDLNIQRDGTTCKQFKMIVKFTALGGNKIHRVDLPDNKWALIIVLDEPPRFWRKRVDIINTHMDDRYIWGENDLWSRITEISDNTQLTADQPTSLHMEGQFINIGRWTAYWFEMESASKENWSIVENSLRDWNIKTKTGADFKLTPPVELQLWNMLDGKAEEPAWGPSKSQNNTNLALLGSITHVELPFDVRYQLEVCISRDIFSEYNITREFLEKLLSLSNPGKADAGRARLILEYAADQGERIYDPMSLFTNKAALTYYPTTMQIPDHCALVRKLTVTPTRVYFNTANVETTNRVIRYFKGVQDNFIRVQFTDELSAGRIEGSDADADDEIYARVYRVLNKGIRMGRWHWDFLAFGNSQIRENSAFFFCQPEGNPEDVVTCDKMRRWMGRFGHIKVIAKYAARLGQCFSTTRLVRGISTPRIVKIPDIERGRYCFTDGVGKMSSLVAQMVAHDWRLDVPPSACQVRIGGCKGVLVAWSDVRGLDVHIRKSQEKFLAEFNGLEIIRCSQFSTATLNRQTITILSSLGVPKGVFTKMMMEQLRQYNLAMTDKKTAIQLLNQYVDENQMTVEIAHMLVDGFMESQEPFVRTLLHLWRSWSMKALKEKARLMVDEGAFVLGCVDETGTLRGYTRKMDRERKLRRHLLPQIFIQVPDRKEPGTYKVITGICIVGRNPSLHPGDIRVVEAVDVPDLRHIRDVVVFPLNGDRDIPSMCSGGDLDGDDFFVIWDKNLIPPIWSYPPMDYTGLVAEEQATTPTLHNLQNFFVLYMKNNTLPLIAHAHLAHADDAIDGAKNAKCLRLAELHSQAVDYVKTGVPAEWSKKLNPRKWPHWMEKRKASYHSKTALGTMYDMIGRTDFMPTYDVPFDKRILTRYKLDTATLKKARQVKSQYDTALRRIMGQLEVETEFEVWSTFVLSKPRVGTTYKLQENVGRESSALKLQYVDLCTKEAGSEDPESLQRFVAAMYQVTWEEVQIALYESRQAHVRPDGTVGRRRLSPKSMPLISFPWLFAKKLGQIATAGESGKHTLADFCVTVPGKGKGTAQAEKPAEMAEFVSEEEHFTRTDDGQIIHRGEVLNLFHHDDEYDDELEELDDDDIVLDPPTEPDPKSVWEENTTPPSDVEAVPEKGEGKDKAVDVGVDHAASANGDLLLDTPRVTLDAAAKQDPENGDLPSLTTRKINGNHAFERVNANSSNSHDGTKPDFDSKSLSSATRNSNVASDSADGPGKPVMEEKPLTSRTKMPFTLRKLDFGSLAGMDGSPGSSQGYSSDQVDTTPDDAPDPFVLAQGNWAEYMQELEARANRAAAKLAGISSMETQSNSALLMELVDGHKEEPIYGLRVPPATQAPRPEPESPTKGKKSSTDLLIDIFGTGGRVSGEEPIDGNGNGNRNATVGTKKDEEQTAADKQPATVMTMMATTKVTGSTDTSAGVLTPETLENEEGGESGSEEGSDLGEEIVIVREESALERAAKLFSK